MAGQVINNVFYIEPNYENADIKENSDGSVHIDMNQIDMENYCVVVDLSVEVPQRTSDVVQNGDNKIIHMIFSSGANGHRTSFFEGSKLTDNDGVVRNYLTTAPYQITTYADISEQEGICNGEMVGINSIDIAYNNYAVPEVTIEFTDIKGMSLFGPEEFRHDKTVNGVSGLANPDIEGSFFKSFFRFPYPIFRLMVKGFYGEPTTYELACQDFRARFDSNTGNYNATVKLVGRAYSLLADVTMNALVTAPYSKKIGQQYWADKHFKFDDGKDMLTLSQVIERYANAKSSISSIPQTSSEGTELQRFTEEQTNLETVNNAYQDLFDRYIETIEEETYRSGYNCFYFKAKKDKSYADKENIKYSKESFDNSVKSATTLSLSKIPDNLTTISLNDLENLLTKHNITLNNDFKQKGIEKDEVIWVLDGFEFNEKIKSSIDAAKNNVNYATKKLTEKSNQIVEDCLGFKPSIYNIMKILMAHLETLVHCIKSTAIEANNHQRTLSQIGLTENNIDLKVDSSQVVGAFPETHIEKIDNNGNTVKELSWIGDVISDSSLVPEIDLIESYLEGVRNVANILTTASNNLQNNNGTEANTLSFPMGYPVCMSDFTAMVNPWEGINFNNFKEVAGRIIMRALCVTLTNSPTEVFSSSNAIGASAEVDAINFINLCQNSFTPNFITAIKDGGTFTYQYVYETVGQNTNNDTMPWGKKAIFDKNGFLNLFHYTVNDNHNYNIPYQDYDVTKIGETDKRLTESKYIETDTGRNIGIIEPNFRKYDNINNFTSEVKALMSRDFDDYTKNLVKPFNINDYYDYLNIKHNIRPKFGSSAKLMTINVPNGNGDNLIPTEKVYTKIDLNFSYGFSADDESKVIKPQDISLNETGRLEDSYSNFTITFINGLDDDLDTKTNVSLFGQKYYYKNNAKGRAFLFLKSIASKFYNYEKIYDDILDYEVFSLYSPKLMLLLIGATSINQVINPEDGKINEINMFNELSGRFYKDCVSLFNNWVDDDNGFKRIDYALGVNFNDKTVEMDDTFKDTYYAYLKNDDGYKFYINENSSINDFLVSEVLTPYLIIKNNPCGFNRSKTATNKNCYEYRLNQNNTKIYIAAFCEKLRKESANLTATTSSNTDMSYNQLNTSKHIKISLYRYFKTLYDTWLCASDEKYWDLENFFIPNWHFIDCYYNDASDILINLDLFASEIIYSQSNDGYQLLSFLSKITARSEFNLQTVQNFISLHNDTDSKEYRKIENLFKAIPFSEIKFDEIGTHPHFVLLYNYAPSMNLNETEGSFNSDGFDIDSSVIPVPKAISSKKISDKSPMIPAFGVTYGMQNQSYFNSIEVGMEKPLVTEQSIKAEFMIGSMNSMSQNNENAGEGEKPRQILFLGQDLYTVYSNQSYTCNIRMMGDAYIQPLMYFQLNNVPMFRGAYLIEKVTHHIEPGNMVTNIVGVKMAAVQTPKISDYWVNTSDTIEEAESVEEDEAEVADCDNNCTYKFFSPELPEGDGIKMSNAELNMSVNDYAKKHGKWQVSMANKRINTILDLITATILAENPPSTYGETAAYGVAVVIYNKWIKQKQNLTKVFLPQHHDIRGLVKFEGNNSEIEKARNIAKDVFSKSASVIVNKEAYVKRPLNKYNNGKIDGRSSTKRVEMSDAQEIDGYCSTLGYDITYRPRTNLEVSSGDINNYNNGQHSPWHYANYAFQADAKNNTAHVFVSGMLNGKKVKYWKPQPKKSDNTKNEDNAFFEAIKQTCNYSKNIHIENLAFKKNGNVMVFTAKNGEQMAQLFDILVNTYYDYCEKIQYVTSSLSNDSLPTQINVARGKNAKKEITVIVNGKVLPFVINGDSNNIPTKFKKSILKKYDNESNLKRISSECLNFSTIISKNPKNWAVIVKNVLNANITLESCSRVSSTGAISGKNNDKYEYNTK